MSGTERDRSNLETDDEMFCKDCGVMLPCLAAIVYGRERCPECEIEQTKKELIHVFGTLSSIEASPAMVTDGGRSLHTGTQQ